MNNTKVLLGLALSILLVLALFVMYPLARNSAKPAKLEDKASGPGTALEVPLMNIITVKVYRSDGRVETYQKVGDPWTQNLMAAMANFLFGRYNTNPLNLYARDGQVKTQVETEYAGSYTASTRTWRSGSVLALLLRASTT